MSKTPLFSIIVPVYNIEKYLNDCLDAFTNQTCQDFELLLIDDGSTDRSGKICQQYADKHSKNTRCFHKKNGGLSDARNYGITKAHGKYLIFIDGDDVPSAMLCATVRETLQHDPVDVVLFGYRAFFDQPVPDTAKSSQPRIRAVYRNDAVLEAYFNGRVTRSACTKAYKRSLFKTLRFPVGRVAEDLAVAAPVLATAKSLTALDNVLLFYRQRPGSLMHAKSMKLFYDAMLAHSEQVQFCQAHRDRLKNPQKAFVDVYSDYFNNLVKAVVKNRIEKHAFQSGELERRLLEINPKQLRFGSRLFYEFFKRHPKPAEKFVYRRYLR